MSILSSLGALLSRRANRLVGLTTQRAGRHRRGPRPAPPPGAAWWAGDPHWFPAGTPPRRHNRVTPLVDGASYLPALCASIRAARHYVYIIGWCLTPHMALDRQDNRALVESQVLALCRDAARRLPVRVLLWEGAPALFRPSARAVRAVAALLNRPGQGDIQCRLDRSAHVTHCHHQKAVVIDGRVAFVGGMDLTTLQGDRWDTTAHPLRNGPNWHDVQVQIEGEAVADVEHNFRQRWQAAGGGPLPHRDPEPDPAWQTPLQIVRTIPRGLYDFAPEGEFGIEHAYLQALGRARHLIYLENQYLWSQGIMDALLRAIYRPATEHLRIVLVLPARAQDGKWDNDRHVDALRRADQGRGRVGIYCLYTGGPSGGRRPFLYRPTYVHAKVAIIDDEWLLVGSANLNHRGLATDSEIDALVHDPAVARDLRVQLWAEHLGLGRAEVAAADPHRLADEAWPCAAQRNAATAEQADGPLTGAVHRYELGHMPGAWLLEEAEAVTFER